MPYVVVAERQEPRPTWGGWLSWSENLILTEQVADLLVQTQVLRETVGQEDEAPGTGVQSPANNLTSIEKESANAFGVPLWHWVWWRKGSGSGLQSWPV